MGRQQMWGINMIGEQQKITISPSFNFLLFLTLSLSSSLYVIPYTSAKILLFLDK
jgi:hypothetical protein